MPGRRHTVVRVAGLVSLLVAVGVVRAWAHVGTARVSDPFTLVYGDVASIAYLVPGVVLLLRRRWHVVGWLLCAVAVTMAVSFGAEGSADGAWAVWLVDSVQGSLAWLPFVVLLVVFPDGLDGRTSRQRRVGRAVVAVAVAAVIPELLATEVGLDGGQLLASPLGDVTFVPRAVKENMILLEFVALAAAFAGMVLRYRSSHAVARRQYRWVLFAIVSLIVALVIGLIGSGLGYDVQWLLIQVAYVCLPVAFMVAILRYRLYEIDRLISRTVTYAVVLAVLGIVYLVVVGAVTEVLATGSELAVAASTLAVAAVVRPLHRRVRGAVDRRFNRTRFDGERELQRFASRLRHETDVRVVESQLHAVVDRTLQPAMCTIWLRRS